MGVLGGESRIINLGPKNNPLLPVGEGLQALGPVIANVLQAQYDKKKKAAYAQASQITDPDQLQQFAYGKSGLQPDDAGDLVKTLTQSRLATLLQTKTKQKIEDNAINIKMDQAKLDEQPLVFQNEVKLKAAEIRQRNADATEAAARAAAIPSEIARNNAESSEARVRTAVEVAAYKNTLDFQKSLLPTAQKTAATPPDATPSVKAAHESPSTVHPDAVTVLKQYRLGKIDQGTFLSSLPEPALPQVQSTNQFHLPDPQYRAIAAMPPEKAMEELAKEATIKKTEDVQVAPGYYQRIGFYPDGSYVKQGPPFEKLNKPNEQDERQVSGLELWQSSIQALEKLSKGGKLGDDETRAIVKGFRSIPGVDATKLAQSFVPGVDASYAYDNFVQHATMAAAQMFPRQSNVVIEQAMKMIPRYSDNQALKNRGFDASHNLTDLIAYNTFAERLADGKPIPESLSNYITKRGLDKMTPDEINARALGIGGLPTIGGGESEGGGGKEGAKRPSNPGAGTDGGDGGGGSSGGREGGSSPPPSGSSPSETTPSSVLKYDANGNLVK